MLASGLLKGSGVVAGVASAVPYYIKDCKDITGSVRFSDEIVLGVKTLASIAQGFPAANLDDIAVLTSTHEGVDTPGPGREVKRSLNYELGSAGREVKINYLFRFLLYALNERLGC